MNNSPYDRVTMLDARFDDFDEFTESVGGVDSTMTLQNPERRSWTLTAADVAGVLVQFGTLGSGNIVEGEAWVDGTTIYLPFGEARESSACGIVIPKDVFMILESGCDFVLAEKYRHDWCSISIPDYALGRLLEIDNPSAGSRKTRCRVTRPNRRLAAQMRTSVQNVLGAAASHADFESSTAALAASASLIGLGATIAGMPRPSHEGHRGRPKIPRDEIIRRAKELLQEREGQHVSVADLVTASGVSERTLRDAFAESFGIGPTRYVQLRTLRNVKRALDHADPDETTVAALLTRHGVWEFGRFAGRYRRLFGELPSDTLHRRHR